MSQSTSVSSGTPSTAAIKRAFREIEQPQAQRHPVEAEALLDDERAIPRQRQRNERRRAMRPRQRARHPVPAAPIGSVATHVASSATPPPSVRASSTPASITVSTHGEPGARTRVVGGLVMRLQRDLPGEVRGHRRAMPLHMPHLPAREPQMQGDRDAQRDQENRGEQRCGIRHAMRRAEACARIAVILRQLRPPPCRRTRIT